MSGWPCAFNVSVRAESENHPRSHTHNLRTRAVKIEHTSTHPTKRGSHVTKSNTHCENSTGRHQNGVKHCSTRKDFNLDACVSMMGESRRHPRKKNERVCVRCVWSKVSLSLSVICGLYSSLSGESVICLCLCLYGLATTGDNASDNFIN